ncbi:hypothetical protein DSO57_1029595 [Entomophthora muscae]|uniref:Uncharacterized protein n=1 Tax=Entomophthora muscae TaxID=34485 RepID=A0ACC2TPA9_9FUNG|nr:hypothetical protein DSO57_1029595 [Entomophthora muscae]
MLLLNPSMANPQRKPLLAPLKKSLKGNLKFENPKELEVKLKYRRERFNAIVGFPLRLVMKVFSYIFSVFRGIFNLFKICVGWSFYVTYWVISKIASLFYKGFLLNPYNFSRYLYYEYGTLIFFCSLPIMFGLLGGIFFATLSEGTIRVLSLYLFPKDSE